MVVAKTDVETSVGYGNRGRRRGFDAVVSMLCVCFHSTSELYQQCNLTFLITSSLPSTIIFQAHHVTPSTKSQRAKPVPPKKRRVFTRTTGGKNNKAASSTNIQHGNGPVTPESSAAAGLKDLSWDKLLRKARDLLKLKGQHTTLISTLRSDIKQLHQAAKEMNKSLSEQLRDHELQLGEERCGHANRITAMGKLHNEEMEKKKSELRTLAKQSFEDKKISNGVSLPTII